MSGISHSIKSLLRTIFESVHLYRPGIGLFHGTFNEEVAAGKQFLPLTHFGSYRASLDRLSMVQDKKPESAFNIIEIELHTKNPLRLEDPGGGHGLGTWEHIFNCNMIEAPQGHIGRMEQFMSDADRHYIFRQPLQMKEADCREELALDSIFNVSDLPDLSGPWSRQEDAQRNTQDCLVMQRLIRDLEKRGYDSVAYINKGEDRGHTSYVVFRPDRQIRRNRVIPYEISAAEAAPGNCKS